MMYYNRTENFLNDLRLLCGFGTVFWWPDLHSWNTEKYGCAFLIDNRKERKESLSNESLEGDMITIGRSVVIEKNKKRRDLVLRMLFSPAELAADRQKAETLIQKARASTGEAVKMCQPNPEEAGCRALDRAMTDYDTADRQLKKCSIRINQSDVEIFRKMEFMLWTAQPNRASHIRDMWGSSLEKLREMVAALPPSTREPLC